jgi:hypothetical protein
LPVEVLPRPLSSVKEIRRVDSGRRWYIRENSVKIIRGNPDPAQGYPGVLTASGPAFPS